MTDRKLMHDLDKGRKKQPLAFWGLCISIVSIIYGEFITRVDGYLLTHSEPYFARLPENIVGVLLITFSLIKLLGVLSNYSLFKKIGIWGLSAIWGGLFILSLTFSFGSGYPHPSYIFMGFIMAACLRVSLKGDFAK